MRLEHCPAEHHKKESGMAAIYIYWTRWRPFIADMLSSYLAIGPPNVDYLDRIPVLFKTPSWGSRAQVC